MRDIETKISPLIAGLFPSFYQTDGPNFIAFVKAYYEWLEQNFQLIDLEDATNFNEGDIITQENVTGKVVSVDGNSILVLVDGLETFKCFNVCSELIPVTSSSGGNSLILRGGTTRRLGSIFMSRNLPNIRDIDKTIDLFVVRFKEKYLKNIEFDTQTNKRLLVKNSLDLYRSKGTSRSIDLFFRLIYGVKSSVYYPGDDLFRLSDAEWFRPQYIEINSTSVDRAISLVGKQITGVNSGATAFVERYVKKKVNAGFVHVFYVSSVRGQFLVDERLKYDQLYPDSPKIVGSFTGATVLDGSEQFNIGDIVNFESSAGLGGIGRVTAVIKGSGEVSFKLADSGWGYTTNRASDSFSYSANTFLSDRILRLANVEAGLTLSNIAVIAAGSGYSNSDTIVVSSRFEDARVNLTTNTTGSIITTSIIDQGSGLKPDAAISVLNSVGGPSSGVGATFDAQTTYPEKYFEYLETVTQPIYTISYANPVGLDLIAEGSLININNIDKFGHLIQLNASDNKMVISMFNNDTIQPGDTVHLEANATNKVDVTSVSLLETTGRVIYMSNTGAIDLGAPNGTIAVGDTIEQRDSNTNAVVASAVVTKTSSLSLTGGIVSVEGISGVFRPQANVAVRGKAANAEFKSITFQAAVIDSSNTFIDTYSPFIYSSNNGTTAFVTGTTSGSNAQYRIATLTDSEEVRLNSDRLSNNTIMDKRLDALAYGFPLNPTANLSSIILGTLNFETMTVGSIGTLGDLNPGTGYNQAPIASIFQPYITGYQARDYVFTINNNETQFLVGEYVTQTSNANFVKVFVNDVSPYRIGELVHAGNTTVSFIANGVVSFINEDTNYVDLELPVGTFPTTNNFNLKSLLSTANSYIINSFPFIGQYTARGIVKDNDIDKVYVKRIQLDNRFVTGNNIVGSLSGTTANLVSIALDESSDPVGLNAAVDTKASTANGVISSIQIIDSGYGFSNDDDILFSTATDDRTGTVANIRGGLGTGTGSYRTSKGFLSDVSKVHDGDYYQEYSYEILSRIPLEKYSDMFKKVMHTAGTRFFGSLLLESVNNTAITFANSSITLDDGSPYVVQDRESTDVQDRAEFFIEIRE